MFNNKNNDRKKDGWINLSSEKPFIMPFRHLGKISAIDIIFGNNYRINTGKVIVEIKNDLKSEKSIYKKTLEAGDIEGSAWTNLEFFNNPIFLWGKKYYLFIIIDTDDSDFSFKIATYKTKPKIRFRNKKIPPIISRRQRALKLIDKSQVGIEIGPSFNPIAPKKLGFKTEIIDHLSKEELLNKYKDFDCQNIEEVDYIWTGQTYSELTGKKDYYGWLIASHVIEHVPDLIEFLNNCSEILKEDGIVSLIIPDSRHCFDCFRSKTSLAQIIDAHLNHKTKPSVGSLLDSYLYTVKNRVVISREEALHDSDINIFEDFEYAQKILQESGKNSYSDIHNWCFTPNLFRLIIHDLYNLKLIPFQEISFCPTEGLEFFINLSKKGKGIDIPRIELMKIALKELGE